MTNAWLVGAATSVPQSESQVRSTIEPIRDDSVTAEQTHAPEFNELDTDESGELVGLSPRVAGSDTVETVESRPWWIALSDTAYNINTDQQVSSSGSAASREDAGQAGHGTMQYALGIEPVIRDGAAFGSDYFVTHPTLVQDGMGNYMTPPDQDNWLSSIGQQSAVEASRDAYQSTQYANFMAGG